MTRDDVLRHFITKEALHVLAKKEAGRLNALPPKDAVKNIANDVHGLLTNLG